MTLIITRRSQRTRTTSHLLLRGFTLVELLTVVAIIVLLVALLTPTLVHTRELTRRAVCKSVFHQQLTGVTQYAAHNRGMLLPGYRYASSPAHTFHDEPFALNADTYESYRDRYFDGDDRLFACPNMGPLSFPRAHLPSEMYILGFNYNGNKPGLNALSGSKYPVGRLDCAEAVTVPLFSDLNNWSVGFGRTLVAHTARGGVGDIYGFGADAFDAGSEGGNYGYADGHVIWLGLDTLTTVVTFYREGPWMGWDFLPEGVW